MTTYFMSDTHFGHANRMKKNKPSYELIHKDCGGLVTATLEDDGGCGNPDCCGEISYHVEVVCSKCGFLYD